MELKGKFPEKLLHIFLDMFSKKLMQPAGETHIEEFPAAIPIEFLEELLGKKNQRNDNS